MNKFNILQFKDKDEVVSIVKRLGEARLTLTWHWYIDYKDMRIIDAATDSVEKYTDDAKNIPAIALIDVILAARNNYERNVLPRINRIKHDYPNLKTFDQLSSFIEERTREEFLDFWDFNSIPKYTRLVWILSQIDKLRKIYPESKNDYELLHNRAKHVNLDEYKNDIIWGIKGIWPATVQHLSMNFWVNTAKPDQRVMEVLKREFDIPNINEISSVEAMEQIAKIIGKEILLIDQIFVKYGSSHYAKI